MHYCIASDNHSVSSLSKIRRVTFHPPGKQESIPKQQTMHGKETWKISEGWRTEKLSGDGRQSMNHYHHHNKNHSPSVHAGLGRSVHAEARFTSNEKEHEIINIRIAVFYDKLQHFEARQAARPVLGRRRTRAKNSFTFLVYSL